MSLIWLSIGVAIGVTFSEGIRAAVRKWTKGRAFGPVPGKDEPPAAGG